MIIGNWEIQDTDLPGYVRATCLSCRDYSKICTLASVKKRPNSTCRKCFFVRSKDARNGWAWRVKKNASTCTAR